MDAKPRTAGTRAGLLSVLLVPLVALLFFAELVVQPTEVLYADLSDLVLLHTTSKRFLARSWQQNGELPRWCPYLYSGMPFLADIQVSAFYPPHWPLLWLAEEYQGAALSWLVVLHVIAAGWCMYAYARHRGLEGAGALTAALGYMLAGKWLLHILLGGHYNMVPLAWLPLVLLFLEQAIKRHSLGRATAAGAAFSLFLLAAYPYVTLYAGLFVALWTLGPALEDVGPERRFGPALGRWLGFGVWTVLVAVLLGAVQLLPGLEVARLASRNLGVSFSLEKALVNGIRSLVGLAGPGMVTDVTWRLEDRGGFGLLWAGTAVLAPLLDPRRRVRFEATATGLWFVLALTGAYVLQALPGFHFFQIPSRMLLVAGLPVALLSGRTVQALVSGAGLDPARCGLARQRFCKTVAVLVLLPVAHAVSVAVQGYQLEWSAYWLAALATVPLAWWLLGTQRSSEQRACLWTVLLLLDLVLIAWPGVRVRSDRDMFTPSASARYVAEHSGEHIRAYAVGPPELAASATPLWPDFPMVLGVEDVAGFNPIDVLRYKEYLQMLSGKDEPLRSLDGRFTSAVLGEVVFANAPLADLLGVRYLLLPKNVRLEDVVPDAAARKAWRPVAVDPDPMVFNTVPHVPDVLDGSDIGYRHFPADALPYTVYENANALPRAFVVTEAEELPERSQVLEKLKTTDFRRRVLLEGWHGPARTAEKAERFPAAVVREYLPDRVTINTDAAAPGFLVLADVWYPGWKCSVDGRPVEVYRANFLFRAVEVPAGTHQLVFTYEPVAYAWGRIISGMAAALLLGLTLLCIARVGRSSSGERATGPAVAAAPPRGSLPPGVDVRGSDAPGAGPG